MQNYMHSFRVSNYAHSNDNIKSTNTNENTNKNNNTINNKQQLPIHILQKLQKHHQPTNKHPSSMIHELIDRLSIPTKYLQSIVLIDAIALHIRSFLTQELHVIFSQSVRCILHSTAHPFNILFIPHRKSKHLKHPLVFDHRFQLQSLNVNLEKYIMSNFNEAIVISNESNFSTIIILYHKKIYFINEKITELKLVPNLDFNKYQVLFLWKQRNIAYIVTYYELDGKSYLSVNMFVLFLCFLFVLKICFLMFLISDEIYFSYG